MRRASLLILSILIMGGVFFSCKKKTDDTNYTSYDHGYYPLKTGKYITYAVDSIIWDDFKCSVDTHHYQMRYSITDTFTDNQKRFSYIVNVLIRKTDTSIWNVDHVFYVTDTATRLEVTENNLRFIKLTYPVKDGNTWNGNAYIPSADQDYNYFYNWTYKYVNTGQTFDDGRVIYNNTVTVTEDNDSLNAPPNYSYRTYAKEAYAYNVGMIYRELIHWTYQPGSCKKGYGIIMRATDNN